jgi:putative ABC transport system permease protein
MSTPRRLRWLVRSDQQIRQEIDEELAIHLEMRVAELERQGWSEAAAREEAVRMFGVVERTRKVCVDAERRRQDKARRREIWSEIRQDVVHGARQLRHRPSFALIAISTLAVAIGATTAVFSATDHVLLRPLPYRDVDRVVTLWETDVRAGEQKNEVSAGNFLDWRARTTSFAALGLAEPWGVDLTGDGPPQSLDAWQISDGFLESLGATPLLGRGFTHAEFEPNGPAVVMLSEGAWRRRFGADASLVGRTILLDGIATTVVGILPAAVEYPSATEVWSPLRFSAEMRADRKSNYMRALGRLKPGVTPGAAQNDLTRAARTLAAEYPVTNASVGVNVIPLEQQVLGEVRPALLVLLGAVAFLLLIACANVAALLLARGAERARELAVRSAIGAGRARLIRQLLTESALLALLGGAGGLLLAHAGVRALALLSPPELPRAATIAMDGRVLLFGAAVTLLTAMLCGLLPALRFSRPQLGQHLRGSPGVARGGVNTTARSALVIGEIALALVLLIGAGLLVRSFITLLANDTGFRSENRVALQMFVWDRTNGLEQRIQRVEEIREHLRSVPGVRDVAMVSALPFHPHAIAAQGSYVIEGRAAPQPGQDASVFVTIASPEYFRTMAIPLRSGRAFASADRSDAPRVAVINATMARRVFPDEDPIGKRIRIGVMGPPETREIVGVVGDVKPVTLDSEPRPELYVPFAQTGNGSITYIVHTTGDPRALIPALQAQVWVVDPLQTIYHTATVDALISVTVATRRFQLLLLGSFSTIALVLAAIGVYGLISFATDQRRTEIGVRMALGARGTEIVSMIVRQGLRLAIPGVALGLLGALALTRFLTGMLYGVTATDPATYLQLSGLMLLVAGVAAFVPARRAASLDPIRSLRLD